MMGVLPWHGSGLAGSARVQPKRRLHPHLDQMHAHHHPPDQPLSKPQSQPGPLTLALAPSHAERNKYWVLDVGGTQVSLIQLGT